MNQKIKKMYAREAASLDALTWEDGLVRSKGPGHTRGAQVEVIHSGVITSRNYVLGRAVGKLTKDDGLRILSALRRLQVTQGMENPDALPRLDAGAQLGAFRWYLEEDRIWDTNAAFFICMPLITPRLLLPECFSEEETAVIDETLAFAGNWFYHECQHAIYYYSNKILSDGAALSAIARLTGNEAYRRMAVEFFGKWLDYTEQRGWGWGENTSLGYNGVIFPALRIAERTIGDEATAQRIRAVLDNQKRFFRFYDGHEVAPSIRTYNYEGLAERPSLVYNLAGVPGSGLNDLSIAGSDMFICFNDELYENDAELMASGYTPVSAPRCLKTRVFDEVYATSWYGEHIALGTLNAFPVISGIDRNATWGLGWQSMPVSFVVYGTHTGYLRFFVNDGEIERAHPKRNYLSPRLFSETILPRITTCSAQDGPIAVTIRAIDRINNRAQAVLDEWYINRFNADMLRLEHDGREFIALRYAAATVIIGALNGMCYGANRGASHIEAVRGADGLLRLQQVFYRGTLQTRMADRVESAWLTLVIDHAARDEEIAKTVKTLQIEDNSWTDGFEPRDEWALLRTVRASLNEYHAELHYGPYRFPGGQH